jgi:sortase A
MGTTMGPLVTALAAIATMLATPTGVRNGAPVATLSIPRLHFQGVVHEGIRATVLANGPGHYPSTALPGQAGTTAVAGHRVTHTHPFLHINLLREGDVMTMTTRWGRFRYRVYREQIVGPTDVAILRNVGFQQLVLTACHPPHTALERYVVFARRIASRT